MRRIPLRSLMLTLALTTSLVAQQNRPTSRPSKPRKPSARQQLREARQFRRLQVPGETVAANIKKLQNLHWHKSLKTAVRASYAKGRPILWIQALGDLKGFT